VALSSPPATSVVRAHVIVNKLSSVLLARLGSQETGATRQARVSADFHVDGMSLLGLLSSAGAADLMGALVQGFAEPNAAVVDQLLLRAAPASPSGRVLLYICPECGDLACGAYSARVAKSGGSYVWSEFAYENGYEEPEPIPAVGPFCFQAEQYESAVLSACAL
jgi:hypothetical protein